MEIINIVIIVLSILMIILLFFIKSSFENLIYKVDKFDENEFIKSFKDKNVIICGNSPQFPNSFLKIKDIPNKFIIRFNTVLDHLSLDEKTDVLFISHELLEKYNKDEFNNWKNKCKKCKIYYIESLIPNNLVLNNINKNDKINFTSGFVCITYIFNHTPKLTIVGFNLPNDYKTPVNWYRENAMYEGHDINKEKILLEKLITENNLIKI